MSSDIQNISIEQSVLVALMTTSNSLEVVANDLTEEHFFAGRHKIIYRAIVELSNADMPYDAVFVGKHLQERNLLNDIGGEEYLIQLNSAIGSVHHLEYFVAELTKLKNHREVEGIGLAIAGRAKDLTVSDIYLEAENLFSTPSSTIEQKQTGFDFNQALEKTLERFEKKIAQKEEKGFIGVQFNIPHLDNLLGTIEKGHFCVIGGRPGSGKSTLAQMCAMQTAKRYNMPVLFISAEMDTPTLTNRMISALGHIPYNNLHNGEIYDGMFEKLTGTIAQFRNLPIFIEEKQKPTISEIQSYARKAKRKYKALGCIIVDYLGLIRDPSKKDRVQEVASISRDLKAMAKEFDCPVIALAQLNRGAEGHKPVASDLKDSGQIEQDADQIIMVHPILEKETNAPTGVTELIIAKNRHGKRGSVNVQDRLDICRFVGMSFPVEERGAA
ncbi:DnaB-like helicase C-terminal domain-containing protein [Acinetobacter baumannii]|uniref:replicative DNA helicase n=1 Tax=Acinetobacter baumannii TaxID=470 RepID=UPI00313BEE40